VTGIVTETETEKGTGRAIGTGMTEIAMLMITSTGIIIQSVVKTGTGRGHIWDAQQIEGGGTF
jgi:hypothetical protein